MTTNDLHHWRARCLVDPDGDCWTWAGSVQGNGRPQATINQKRVSPHREAWQLVNGPLAPGMYLPPRCKNKRCINPAHHKPATSRQFFHTLAKQGVLKRGPTFSIKARSNALKRKSKRLQSLDDARAIRAAAHAGESKDSIAAKYRITVSMVTKILADRCWRETTPFSGLGA